MRHYQDATLPRCDTTKMQLQSRTVNAARNLRLELFVKNYNMKACQTFEIITIKQFIYFFIISEYYNKIKLYSMIE